jgi:nicotinamide-nucleotide amidase
VQNTDEKLKARAQQALDALKAANVTIVTAESCTAGTIAALLAQAEGASDILHGSFITYTKEHKTKALGVPWRLLKEQGAVNADVVKQLAAGALERSPATLAIPVSGVLGPEPDEDDNPVGLVYFCIQAKDKQPKVVKEEFGQQPHELPVGVGPEDHPLLRAVQGSAVVEQLGALLTPVAGPVGAGGAVAVEAGKDVEGVGSGHDALLECG